MSTTFFRANEGPQTSMFSLSPGGVRSILRISKMVDGNNGASNLCAVLTDHPIEESTNTNLMYAADGHVYMNVCGDKIGTITISGIAFSQLCGGSSSSRNGFAKTLQWYRDNRISLPENTQPIEITVGDGSGGVLKGYPGSFNSRVADANNRLYSFNFLMYLAPAGGIGYVN
jgi:hypothetical protein